MHRTGSYRYGKTMSDIFLQKKYFISENDNMAHSESEIYNLYRMQKLRECCKICSSSIPQIPYFTNHGTDFYLCDVCGHLNGAFDDGIEYTEALYKSGLYDNSDPQARGIDIVQFYERMDTIFVPKVRFMLDTFNASEIIPETMKYLEIGAGAGHMSYAIDRIGLDVLGIEISELQVEYANNIAKKELLRKAPVEEIANIIKTTEREVVIFINVLEHATNLTEILDSVKANRMIKYIYFCVPLLSLTCAFEVMFPDIYARHLGGGGGHTHLFSQKSLDYIFDKYSFRRIATWNFGVDIMDLFRSICVTLLANKCHPDMVEKVSMLFQEHADAMQLIIDKADFQSDVHIIAQVH